MKTFKGYLKEGPPAWTESLSTMLFDLPRAGLKDVKIPISPSIFKRVWPESIRSIAFHVTDYVGIQRLIKMQGGKRSISAFYNMDFDMISYGIRTEGGYVAELEADVLIAAPDDIASQPDKSGRRWITFSTLLNPPDASDSGLGGKAKLRGMDKDIEEMLWKIIKTHSDYPDQTPSKVEIAWTELGYIDTPNKTIGLIIKDYIDGMEKIIKKHSKSLRSLFTDYVKSRVQEPDPDSGDFAQWDELVVNNFKIKKVHVGQEFAADFEGEDALDMYGLPFETWDDDGDLMDYITRAMQADKGK